MKKIIASAIALTFAGVAATAFAEPARAAEVAAAATTATAAADMARVSEKVETRRYCIVDTPTGSRLRRKECNTRAQWLKQGFDPLATK